MAPSKLPPCKVCNKKEGGKYRCPLDHVDYCSVVCFKQHKEKDCRSQATYNPPPLPLLAATTSSNSTSKADDSRPTKRLKDLHWPAEPNPILWEDPLQRDDVKPLRPFEYEAIATCPELRAVLASETLQTTLTRISNLPRHAKEPSMRHLLGLTPEALSTQYRPDLHNQKFQTGIQTKQEIQFAERLQHQQQNHSPNYRGNGRGRGRGIGRGFTSTTRLLETTPEEKQQVEQFAQLVRNALQRAREKNGELK
ncbi:zinc finger HIT domain-containing protein [Sporobolomyces koalae]|uniref:zinc finger HIT domain-containing protein n=1 Tax=Sporobolomyces koalae TaxID=500713 RepID=UPI0031736EC0